VIRLEDLDSNFTFKRWKRPPIILTFDDGLASVIDLALPILRAYRISAVMFVTTDWIDSSRTPDIFLLEKAILESIPVNLAVQVEDKKCEWRINSQRDVGKAFTRLWEFLFKIRFPPLKLDAQHIEINGKTWERQKSEDRYFWFPASWEEIHGAVQGGLIEIGSHMISHIPLQWLTEREKLMQMEGSREILSRMIGLPVTACSYPHGIIDEKTIQLSEGVYKWGFTGNPGRINENTRRNRAPRYHVPGEAPQSIMDTIRWGHTISCIKRVLFSW
jgi:peptidoglycan/xylan/chitin deacetylase (PgdA/CDA1 family)